MPLPMNKPPRRLCDEVLEAVSREYRFRTQDVLFSAKPEHAHVRGIIWEAILDRSGCSVSGLAHVWGVHHTSILSNLKRLRRQVAISA